MTSSPSKGPLVNKRSTCSSSVLGKPLPGIKTPVQPSRSKGRTTPIKTSCLGTGRIQQEPRLTPVVSHRQNLTLIFSFYEEDSQRLPKQFRSSEWDRGQAPLMASVHLPMAEPDQMPGHHRRYQGLSSESGHVKSGVSRKLDGHNYLVQVLLYTEILHREVLL